MHLIITLPPFIRNKNPIESLIKSGVLVVTRKSLLSFLYCSWADDCITSIFHMKFTILHPVAEQLQLRVPVPWGQTRDLSVLHSDSLSPAPKDEMTAHPPKALFCLLLTHPLTGYGLNRGSNFSSLREMTAWAGDVLFLRLYHTSQTEEGKCHLTDKSIFSTDTLNISPAALSF